MAYTIDTSEYPDPFANLMKSFNSEANGLMKELEIGKVSSAEWQDGMEHLITKYTIAARLVGNGNDSLTPKDVEIVRQRIEQQKKYLDGFTSVISSAGGTYNPAWEPRAMMYGTATSIEYWEGVTEGLPLPAQPAQGTQCLSNCRCSWRIDWIDKKHGSADCYWELGSSDHCQTCKQRHAMWYPIQIRGGALGEAVPAKPPSAPKPPASYDRPLSDWRDVFNDTDRRVSEQVPFKPGVDELRRMSYSSLPKDLKLYNAMRDYSGDAYFDINKYLRDPNVVKQDYWDDKRVSVVKRSIRQLNQLFDKMPSVPENYTLVRGGRVPSTLTEGSLFSDNAFISTSTNANVAKGFSSQAVFVIDVPKGTKVVPINGLSRFAHEQEVLLRAGTKFRVNKIVQNPKVKGLVYYVTIEE